MSLTVADIFHVHDPIARLLEASSRAERREIADRPDVLIDISRHSEEIRVTVESGVSGRLSAIIILAQLSGYP